MVEHFADQGASVGFLDVDRTSGEALVASLSLRAAHVPGFVPCDVCDIDALRGWRATSVPTISASTRSFPGG
jgi:hypothetical protein